MEVIDRFQDKFRFLSNFVGGSEQKYQAAKCKPGDPMFGKILAATPSDSKKMARKIELRDDWEDIKLAVMMKCLRQKFHWTKVPGAQEDPRHLFAQALVDTGDALLIEGNFWHDNFWGDCQCVGEECILTPGKNWLGRLLMLRRSELVLERAKAGGV